MVLQMGALFVEKHENPELITPQQLLSIDKVLKIVKVNKYKNGDLINTLNSVDIHEIFEFEGKVFKIQEGVICKKSI